MKASMIMNERLSQYDIAFMDRDELVETFRDFAGVSKPSIRELERMADEIFAKHKCYIEIESVHWEWINLGAYGYCRVVYLYEDKEAYDKIKKRAVADMQELSVL